MYAIEKAQRVVSFYRNKYGLILEKCLCCNGSGHYDNTNAPNCGNCEGTGKEKINGKKRIDLNIRFKQEKDDRISRHQNNLLNMTKSAIEQSNKQYSVDDLSKLSNSELTILFDAAIYQLVEYEMVTDRKIKAYYG